MYEPLKEISGLKEDEFVLIRYELSVHSPLLTANAKWTQEIAHDNALWLNPEAAQRLRIKDGDVVTITSEAGSVACRAQLRQGIHPRVVALAAGAGHRGYGHIAQAKAFKSDDPDTALLWWGHGGNGINVNELIPLALDPIGKGQAWMDTTVTISRGVKIQRQRRVKQAMRKLFCIFLGIAVLGGCKIIPSERTRFCFTCHRTEGVYKNLDVDASYHVDYKETITRRVSPAIRISLWAGR